MVVVVVGVSLTTDLGEVVKLVLYCPGSLAVVLLVAGSRPRLQRSESQRQAEVARPASSDTRRGRHWSSTTRGFSTLPRRVARGRHSRMTESEPSDCCQE